MEISEQNQENIEVETLGAVFKKFKGVIIVLFALLVALVGFSFGVQTANAKKSDIYVGYWAPDLGIRPIDVITSGDGETVYSGTILTETAPVEDSYFASTVLIGDSLTQGLSLFGVFDDFISVAKLGINPQNALTDKFYKITNDSAEITMADAVEYYKPQKIYIMLGANGINTNTTEWLIENYEILVDELMTRVTGCSIVVQSITPVTRERAAKDPEHYSLENIQKYNTDLKDLAMRKGLYFLDVYSAIADEEGYMPSDMTSGDGIHMKESGYVLWHNYLITHIIQGDSAYMISADGLVVPAAQETAPKSAEEATVDPAAEPTDDTTQAA